MQKKGKRFLEYHYVNIHTSLPLTRTLKFPILLHGLLYREFCPVEKET